MLYETIILDDELFLLEQMTTLLQWKELGFNIIKTFDNSQEALNFIENNKIDVVISDIKMPKPDGIELAKICFENYPYINFVLVSGYSDFSYAQSALKYNVVNYITKPIN